jgi:hypothetical protein
MEVRGVVLFFEHELPKKNEGPSNGEAVGRLPFALDTEESTPGLLGRDAFHEVVSGRFLEPLVAAFARGLNSHGLEPGAHRQPVVEGQLGECSNLAGRALCHILATIWATVELCRFRSWMKVMMLGE